MSKETEIKKAVRFLNAEGFKVIKISEAMKKDMEECEKMGLEGESKDCLGCSCGMCLMQGY